jgi:hypothetical protein
VENVGGIFAKHSISRKATLLIGGNGCLDKLSKRTISIKLNLENEPKVDQFRKRVGKLKIIGLG